MIPDVRKQECKEQCIRLTGKSIDLDYDDMARVTGYAKKTLYKLKYERALPVVSEHPTRFDWQCYYMLVYHR